MIEAIGLFIGIIAGIITGLVPGLHTNLIASLITGASYKSALTTVIFLTALSIARTFVDTVPSVFLSGTNEKASGAKTVQKLLSKKEGYDAVVAMTAGGLFGTVMTILLLPLLYKTIPFLYSMIKPFIGILLLAIAGFAIVREETVQKKFWALLVFVVSGILGMISISAPINQPLLPLLSGLFGISGIVFYLANKIQLPQQYETSSYFKLTDVLVGTFAGMTSAIIITLFPGLGPAHAAGITSILFRIKEKTYLIALGGLQAVDLVVSIATLATIGRARNGTLAIATQLLQFNETTYFVLFACVLVGAGAGAITTIYLGKTFARILSGIDYGILLKITLLFLVLLVAFVSGPLGLILLALSTAVGLVSLTTDCARNHAMGALIIPVVWYVGVW